MNSFARVLRLALRHRLTLVACLFSSLAVAVLWGGNITALYPVIDVVMQDKSLIDWVDDHVEHYEATVAALEANESLDNHQQQQLATAQKKLWRWQRAQPFIHRYCPHTAFDTLVFICVALLVATVVKGCFRVLSVILVARLAHLAGYELRKQFYRRTLRLDLACFNDQGRGDLMNRFTTDVHMVTMGVQTVLGQAVREPLKMIACLIGAAWISWRLLLLTAIAAPLAGWLIRRLAKSLKRANRRALEELSSIYESLTETFAGIKVIKAFTMEQAERSRFHESAKQYYRRSMKIGLYNSLVSPLTETMGMAMVIVAAVVGGYLVLNEQTHLLGLQISDERLTHGMMGLFFGFLAGASDPARRLSNVFNQLQQAAAASDRIFELFDREPTVVDPPQPLPMPSVKQRIAFEGVHFRYAGNHLPVLSGVDLTIEAGEAIAIVGPNGCGKSTLMNLLARFYDPTEGRISIDGVDLKSLRRRDLRGSIGLVTQETLLFNASVARNIGYGSPGARLEEIVAAARRAHADRFIREKLSSGYDTIVGPSGNRLSGGQRQRIALARAILRDPRILILDEATSQIDLESEQLIHEVLEDFVADRTTLLITHRVSTLSLADRIVVMDQGQIVDVGTHAELSARCDLFRRLTHIEWRESA